MAKGDAPGELAGGVVEAGDEVLGCVDYASLVDELIRIRRDMVKFATDSRDLLDHVHPDYRDSAENLLHYIALRSCDRRDLQLQLASAGLSSIGRAESHV